MSGPFASQNNAPYILAQSNVPVCLAPNGTVAATGVVTLGTALPRTYSVGIWLRLPAGAIVSGASGLYWCVMSSTTVGQVYTKFVDTSLPEGFIPYVPTETLVAAVGSAVGYVQTTAADVVLYNLTLPGNALGKNGQLIGNIEFAYNIAAGNKTFKTLLDNTLLLGSTRATTGGHDNFSYRFRNSGVANSNAVYPLSESNSSSGIGYTITAIDTAINRQFTTSINLDTATNLGVIESISLQVLPS